MSPAKVTNPEGKVFFVPKGQLLNNQKGFQLLGEREQEDMGDVGVFGTEDGYKIVDFIGREGGHIEVSKDALIIHPPKEGWVGVDLENGVYTLRVGTKVEPVTTEEMNSTLRGKER